MPTLADKLPEWARCPLGRLRSMVRAIKYYGNERYCPICKKSSRKFAPYGVVPRDDAQCVHCNSLERHRFLWLYVNKKTNLFDGNEKKMLHVAPELCFESRFRQLLGENYITADLFNSRVMVKMDITNINYPNEFFDVIYCSHVLEHVQDDRKAMREFYRTLKSSGWAILTVPITTTVTFEDPTIVEPEERLRVFGQKDHVRRYGRDYVDRLRDAGFEVEITNYDELVSSNEMLQMGLSPDCGEIYYCTK